MLCWPWSWPGGSCGASSAGIAWSFVGGLLFDLVAGLPLGTSSLALMTVCFLTGLGETNLFQGNIFLPVIVIVLATPLHAGMVLLTRATATRPGGLGGGHPAASSCPKWS